MYMILYHALDSSRDELENNPDGPKYGHALIQKLAKVYKKHRNARDFDCAVIESITKKMRTDNYATER